MNPLAIFLSGAVAFGYFVCGLFFLRFYRPTRDPLFRSFALAFFLLGIGQTVLTLSQVPTEQRAPIFLFRLAAYALIIFAILRKNRSAA